MTAALRRDFTEVLPKTRETGESWGDGLLPKWRARQDQTGHLYVIVDL